jgi:Asp-tRNA(Asn)/Glu-tRNA(Gln) amidotransferase B subunit
MSDDLRQTLEAVPIRHFRRQSHRTLSPPQRGITMAGAKFIFKLNADHFNKTGQHLKKTIVELADEHDLWMVDGWSHLGYAIVTCLENPKLVDSYNKGNQKVLDTLIGKTVRSANMTVDPELIKDMIPHIITKWFNKQ